MRTGYQTVPSSRTNVARGRSSRLRVARPSRIHVSLVTNECSTRSQNDLSSTPVPPSPATTPEQESPTVGATVVCNAGLFPENSSIESAPGSPQPRVEGDTVEIPSLTTAEVKGPEPTVALEPPQKSSVLGSLGGFMPILKTSPPLEDYENFRTVSCTSTVFYDAPCPLPSHPDLLACTEEQPVAVETPGFDDQSDCCTEQPPDPSPAQLGPERTVSSNYSTSRCFPSASPVSPTSPRSPVTAAATLREELPSEIETMRRRIFSLSSDMFKSSTWERDSDLDLPNFGRPSPQSEDVDGRCRASSEESTVVGDDRSIYLPSRAASVSYSQMLRPSGGQMLRPSRSMAVKPAHRNRSGHWNDGPTDVSAPASDARALGPRRSAAETCTITSTQAIKSRTFSSVDDSGTSVHGESGGASSGTGEDSALPLSSTSNATNRDFGTARILSVSGLEPTIDGTDELETRTTQTTTTEPPPSGIAGWVRRIWERYSPVAATKSIARLFGYGTSPSKGVQSSNVQSETTFGVNTSESKGRWGVTRIRSRGSWRKGNRSVPRKRTWRVRMPWMWRRKDDALLLAGGSTEG